jgi:signal transduction histidine kinase
MRTLIQDLLAFSRVESEGSVAKPTDTAASLQDALNDLQLVIESSGATIHTEQLPAVMADQFQLTQVFNNLVSNAIKYCEIRPEIRIRSSHLNERVVIEVSDNGIGIAPSYRQRVFGIFKRLHGRGVYTGNGIGLAICKRIVERFGGRIWVDENPSGRGSSFKVEFEAANCTAESQSTATPIILDSSASLQTPTATQGSQLS